MSKKKHKATFKTPPRTLEKYTQTLVQSDSGDTVSHPSDDTDAIYSGPTDSSLREDMLLPKPLKESGFLSSLKKIGNSILAVFSILGGLALVIGIVWFFWGMSNSIDLTKDGLKKVDTKVEELGKESRAQDQDIKISLTKILEKFDRLFDNIQKTKK